MLVSMHRSVTYYSVKVLPKKSWLHELMSVKTQCKYIVFNNYLSMHRSNKTQCDPFNRVRTVNSSIQKSVYTINFTKGILINKEIYTYVMKKHKCIMLFMFKYIKKIIHLN